LVLVSLHQVVLLLLHLLHAAEKHAGVVKGLIFSTVLIRSSVSAVMVSLLQDAEGCALLYAFRVSRLGEVIVSSKGTWGVGNLFWPMLCLFLWSFIFRGFLVCLFSFYSRCFFLAWTSCDPGISCHLLGLVVYQVHVSPIPPWGQGKDAGPENI
jgi:hypothetical protein